MHFVFLTIDATHAIALREAAALLRQQNDVDLTITIYNAPSLAHEEHWQRLVEDIARADFVFGSMLFGETYVRRLETLLKQAPCPVCIIMSNPALIHCTRIGKFVIQSRGEEQEAGVLQRLMQSFRPRHGQGVAETFLLDETMRERLAKLNPHATAAMSRRLLASSSRGFWDTDEATLEALRSVYDDLEDRMEGVGVREVSG